MKIYVQDIFVLVWFLGTTSSSRLLSVQVDKDINSGNDHLCKNKDDDYPLQQFALY